MKKRLYYENRLGCPPNPLLIKSLELVHKTSPKLKLPTAIDLGCGCGNETVFLIEKKWKVFAIDNDPIAFEFVDPRISSRQQKNFKGQVQSFEKLTSLPQAQLVMAFNTLPFCRSKKTLVTLLKMIQAALVSGGYFAATLFGPDEEWVRSHDAVGVTPQELSKILSQCTFKRLRQVKKRAPSAVDGMKPWHMIEVIARKD